MDQFLKEKIDTLTGLLADLKNGACECPPQSEGNPEDYEFDSLLDKLIHRMNRDICPSWDRLDFTGGIPGATSEYNSEHSAMNAFQPEKKYPWASANDAVPAMVWFKFMTPARRLSKISLTSRRNGGLDINQAPQEFAVVGSQDETCETWTTMMTVPISGFDKPSQTLEWEIPCDSQQPYKCIGVKVERVGGNSGTGHENAAIANITMWGGYE